MTNVLEGFDSIWSARIQQKRCARFMSYLDVSRSADVPVKAIRRAERLPSQVPLRHLWKILTFYGLTEAERLELMVVSRFKPQLDHFDDEHVKIKDFVRDVIVFARHDVSLDPPFLKLDLISCRNVLIYFNTKLQERILMTFCYALDSGGLLFLGKSETTSAGGDGLFEQADKSARIYYRSGKRSDLPQAYSRSELNREAALQNKDRGPTNEFELFNSVVKNYSPDSVLVDGDGRIKHLFGGASKYLNLPKGAPTVSIVKLVPKDVAIELTALLHRAAKSDSIVRGGQSHNLGTLKNEKITRVSVAPLIYDNRRDYLVGFESLKPQVIVGRKLNLKKDPLNLSAKEQNKYLKEELAVTKEHLQTLVEEHETTNEEFQALNEELQSSNEELQSTNEELETANEELQSTNEELTTLNQEVNVKSMELQALNQRFQAIQNAIFYPLLIVDQRLRLLDYNPASRYLFRVTDADKGSPIKHLAEQLEIVPVIKMAEECVRNGRESKSQIRLLGHDYEIRIQLFRGHNDQVEGAILSFVDNTEHIGALSLANVHRKRLDAVLEHSFAHVTMKDPLGTYVYVNEGFCSWLGVAQADILGKTDEEIFGDKIGEKLRSQDYEVVRSRSAVRFDEVIEWNGRNYHWLASKFPLLDERKKVQSICTISLDISERVQHEKRLEVFRRVIGESNVGMAIFEGKDIDSLNVTYVSDRLAARLDREYVTGEDHTVFLDRLFQGVSREESKKLRNIFSQGEMKSCRLNLSESSGAEDWCELRTSVIQFKAEKSYYGLLMLIDINDQMKTLKIIQASQDEITRYSRLATIGELAAGISHEINTPLNVILGKAQLLNKLRDKEKLDHAAIEKVSSDIEQMIKNISGVITGLKSLSGLDINELEYTNLTDAINEAVQVCEFKVQRYGVKLSFEAPSTPLMVNCNRVQIMQIIINLINNSIDAIATVSEKWIRIELINGSNFVDVLVMDSGSGVRPDLAEKIMAPFFTTKEKDGTGLGLSLSRTIARKHGGDLKYLIGTPHTSFKLSLPLGKPDNEKFGGLSGNS